MSIKRYEPAFQASMARPYLQEWENGRAVLYAGHVAEVREAVADALKQAAETARSLPNCARLTKKDWDACAAAIAKAIMELVPKD